MSASDTNELFPIIKSLFTMYVIRICIVDLSLTPLEVVDSDKFRKKN